MFVFGVDVPLIEVILTLSVITIILFIMSLVILVLMINQYNKIKHVTRSVVHLSSSVVNSKRKEMRKR